MIDFQLLSAWLKMADVRDVQLFWLVDQWVSEFMSSNSESGYFGTDNEALFFRELAENVPYLADLLVRTEGVNWKATSEVLKELLVSRSRVGNKGRLQRRTALTQQSSLLRWLAFNSSEEQREVFTAMLDSMITAPQFVKAGPQGQPDVEGWMAMQRDREVGQKWLKKINAVAALRLG